MEPKDLDVIPKKKTTAYPSTSESAKRLGVEPKDPNEISKKESTAHPSTWDSVKRPGFIGTKKSS